MQKATASPKLNHYQREARWWQPFFFIPIRKKWRLQEVHWLKPTLSFLFAITTPFGMTLGMILFRTNRNRDIGKLLSLAEYVIVADACMILPNSFDAPH